MGQSPYEKYGLTCRQGAFYICADQPTRFLGCCTVDPCTSTLGGVCPGDSIRNSSYSNDVHYEIPPEACANTNDGSLWYTCQFNQGEFAGNDPFMGCCKNNPCHTGSCGVGNLTAAVLSSNETNAAAFLEEKTNGKGGLSTGAIVGIAVGAAAVVCIIVAFLMFRLGICFRKKMVEERGRHQPVAQNEDGAQMEASMAGPMGPGRGAFRDSYMTQTTAYSPAGTPNLAGHKHLSSPSSHSTVFSSPGTHVDSVNAPQSRHVSGISGISGFSGYSDQGGYPSPTPLGHQGWGQGQSMGVQPMSVVAELPDERPMSELPDAGASAGQPISELPVSGGRKKK